MEKVLADEFANVTFSGGDPMFQPEGFTEVAKAIKAKSQKTIWCYTGYKFEDLIKNPAQAALLSYIDVLVDGRYKQTLRDESLLFRGSSNQRLIDVQASLNKKGNRNIQVQPFHLRKFSNYSPDINKISYLCPELVPFHPTGVTD